MFDDTGDDTIIFRTDVVRIACIDGWSKLVVDGVLVMYTAVTVLRRWRTVRGFETFPLFVPRAPERLPPLLCISIWIAILSVRGQIPPWAWFHSAGGPNLPQDWALES
jgi:hypothetical protein